MTPSAAPAGIGRGNPHQIAVWVDEAVLPDGAATVTIKLETAADEAFAVPIAVETSRPIPKAELLQGRDVFVTVIPPKAKQYIRLYYDVSAGPLTAGKFTAYVGPRQRDDSRKFYPKAALARA